VRQLLILSERNMLQIGIDICSRHFGCVAQINDCPLIELATASVVRIGTLRRSKFTCPRRVQLVELFQELDDAVPGFIPNYLEMSLL